MALVGTLLMSITMGAVEYGWLFLKQQQIVNAARQGARIASTVDATSSQVTSAIQTMMNNYGFKTSDYTPTLTPSDVSTATRGQTVTVTIAVPYSKVSVTHIVANWLPVPSTITANVSMQKEGP